MTQTTLATIPKLIAQVLSVYDVNSDDVFKQSGIVLEKTDINQRIAMETMTALWQRSVEATDNEQLGLVAASLFQPTYLKGIGLAWMASVNLEDGLRHFINGSQMINTAMQIELVEKQDELVIEYQSKLTLDPKVKVHPCAIQLGVGFFLKMFRMAASKTIPATSVHFTFPIESSAQAEFERYFECPVYGNKTLNSISFSRSLLQELLPTHDPELVEINEAAINKRLWRQ